MARFQRTFTPSSSDVDVDEIYDICLYSPTKFIDDTGATEHTFEALNGGLTGENTSSIAGSVKSEHFRSGTFARGYHYGFTFPERYNEAQFTVDTDSFDVLYSPQNRGLINRPKDKLFTQSYGMCANLFIPWDAVVYINYHAFFDPALFQEDNINTLGEDWELIGDMSHHRLYIDGVYQEGTETKCPPSRDDAQASETANRWHSKTKVVHVGRGYHNFEVMIYLLLQDHGVGKPDFARKIAALCGGLNIVAIKSGAEKNFGIDEWYGVKTDDLVHFELF